MKISHNVEFKIGDSKLLLSFIAALILLLTVSCGGGGGGGGGGAVGGSSSPVVAVSFDGLSRSAAGGRSAVWTVADSIDLTIYIDDAVVLKTTVTQANSAVSVEDVTIGSKARATAVVHRIGGTTSTAVSDEIITVAGTNTLTLYIEYQCVLNDISPVQTITYTSKTGLNLPQRGSAAGVPHIAWKTTDGTRYPIGPVDLSGGSPGDLVLTPVYEYSAPVISFSGTPVTEEITLSIGGSANNITVDANIDSVVWDGLGGIVSVANSGFSHTITASSAGTATITAANSFDPTKKTTCTIKVIDGTFDISGGVISNCSVSGDVTIPEKLAGQTVTSIGGSAFRDCTSLTGVSIPDSVTSIGYSAFQGCTGLTSVTIPASVTTIVSWAFNSCTGLTSVTIPASVTTIGEYAFENCSKLESVTIPAGVTSIGTCAFDGCEELTSVTISVGVTSIGQWAFKNCKKLTSVTIPATVTEIGYGAFQGCTGLTSVTISAGVTKIGDLAFQECTGLTSVNIPYGVTSIGGQAFYKCTSLTSVTIPASVVEIKDWAFRDCAALNMVTCYAPVTLSFGTEVFPISPRVETLQCPDTAAYNSEPWISYFVTISPTP